MGVLRLKIGSIANCAWWVQPAGQIPPTRAHSSEYLRLFLLEVNDAVPQAMSSASKDASNSHYHSRVWFDIAPHCKRYGPTSNNIFYSLCTPPRLKRGKNTHLMVLHETRSLQEIPMNKQHKNQTYSLQFTRTTKTVYRGIHCCRAVVLEWTPGLFKIH